MSIEKQIRQQIEKRIAKKADGIDENDIFSYFESREFSPVYAGEEENCELSSTVHAQLAVVVTTDTKNDFDLTDAFLDLLSEPVITLDESIPEQCREVRCELKRTAGDLAKDHYKGDTLLFDVSYILMKINEPEEEREYVIDDGDIDNSFIEKRFNNAF